MSDEYVLEEMSAGRISSCRRATDGAVLRSEGSKPRRKGRILGAVEAATVVEALEQNPDEGFGLALQRRKLVEGRISGPLTAGAQ